MNKLEELVVHILNDEQTLDAPKLANLLYTRDGRMSSTLFDAYLKISRHLLAKLHEQNHIELQADGWYAPLTPETNLAADLPGEVQLKPPKSY